MNFLVIPAILDRIQQILSYGSERIVELMHFDTNKAIKNR